MPFKEFDIPYSGTRTEITGCDVGKNPPTKEHRETLISPAKGDSMSGTKYNGEENRGGGVGSVHSPKPKQSHMGFWASRMGP